MEKGSSESVASEESNVIVDSPRCNSDDLFPNSPSKLDKSFIVDPGRFLIDEARELDDSVIADNALLLDLVRELDASFSEEQSYRVPVTKEISYPHVPMSLEEVSLVTSLDLWSNTNVRVIGKVFAEGGVKTLVSVAEKGGPYMIRIDTSLLDADPPENTTLQVFGELEIISNMSPPTVLLKAKLFRHFDSVDLRSYDKSVEILKKLVPLFVIRNSNN